METIILVLALWFGPADYLVAEREGYESRAECETKGEAYATVAETWFWYCKVIKTSA